MVPYTIKESRVVSVCVPTFRDVECKYTEMVPRIIKDKVTKTVTERRVREVDDVRQVCRTVCTPYTDECGRCCTKCERHGDGAVQALRRRLRAGGACGRNVPRRMRPRREDRHPQGVRHAP